MMATPFVEPARVGGLWSLTIVAIGAVLAAQGAPTTTPRSQLRLSDELIGELSPGSTIVLAKGTGEHIALVAKKGSAHIVTLDAKQLGTVYDDVDHLRFSADDQHLAFIAKRNSRWTVVVDGVDRSKPYSRLTDPALNADGSRYAVGACLERKCRLVLDGQENDPLFDDVSAPAFAPSVDQYGYVGKRNKKWVLQLDGKPHGPELNEFGQWQWRTSNTATRVAIAGRMDKKWTWVVDGVPGPGFEVISDIAFSPDYQHSAYGGADASTGFARYKTRGAMVEDGRVVGEYEGRGFGGGVLEEVLKYPVLAPPTEMATGARVLLPDLHGVSTPQYSPAGALVYAARRKDDDVVVITGGTSGPSFEDVVSPIAISLVGSHIAYVIKRGDQLVEVRDHQPGASVPVKRTASHVGLMAIGPSGEHLAFEVVHCSRGKTGRCLRRVVVNSQGGAEYNAFGVRDLGLGDDARTYHYTVLGAEGNRDRVVFDGLETRLYDHVFTGTLKRINDRTIRFVAQDGLRIVRVTAVQDQSRVRARPSIPTIVHMKS
jgi:hypothetical protein